MRNDEEKRLEAERKREIINNLSIRLADLLKKPVPQSVVSGSYQKANAYKAALKKATGEIAKVRKTAAGLESAYSDLNSFYRQ